MEQKAKLELPILFTCVGSETTSKFLLELKALSSISIKDSGRNKFLKSHP